MRKLETSGGDNLNIDNDSILAPLSQIEDKQHLNEMISSQHLKLSQNLNKSVIVNDENGNTEDESDQNTNAVDLSKSQGVWNKYLLDSDDDFLNDFSMCLDDVLPSTEADTTTRYLFNQIFFICKITLSAR